MLTNSIHSLVHLTSILVPTSSPAPTPGFMGSVAAAVDPGHQQLGEQQQQVEYGQKLTPDTPAAAAAAALWLNGSVGSQPQSPHAAATAAVAAFVKKEQEAANEQLGNGRQQPQLQQQQPPLSVLRTSSTSSLQQQLRAGADADAEAVFSSMRRRSAILAEGVCGQMNVGVGCASSTTQPD